MDTHVCIDADSRLRRDKMIQTRGAGGEEYPYDNTRWPPLKYADNGWRLTGQTFKISWAADVSRYMLNGFRAYQD